MSRAGLRADVLAGLTAAAVVVPKAMAYATIAGLPVQIGLYTAIVPMVVYAALGTSRPLSVSTTTTIAILTAAEVARLAPDGAPDRMIAVATTLAPSNASDQRAAADSSSPASDGATRP